MKVSENPSLKALNTLGVEARAGLLLTLESEEDLLDAPGFSPATDLILGGGSNLLLVSDVPGTVFLNRIRGKHILEEHDGQVLIEVGAGENWHDLVLWSLHQRLCGLENLSLIPGLAGAAPMQNIGAYGVELSSVLDTVTAWDSQLATWVSFDNEQCQFEYRDSFFKSVEADRYLITSIRLRLNRQFRPHLHYAGLKEEIEAAGITNPTAREVSEAVVRIRRRKLPDPAVEANAGSFFKNPVVSMDEAELLHGRHPGLPTWPAGADLAKVGAAWMIEQCGWKGKCLGQAGVSSRHALVISNKGGASGREIMRLSERVSQSVFERFGIRLEPEPRLFEFT
jgi:UDP-N-acetylmuramate dehydrogenase